MTEQEQIAHLLRRFGLGAGRAELARYVPLGVDGTLDRLIDAEDVPDPLALSAWRFVSQDDGTLALDPFQIIGSWSWRLLTTERPLVERMTLFWHDHFAVSAEDTPDGPAMLDYLSALRQAAMSDFRTVMGAAVKSVAFISYLDVGTSQRGQPNENFGREVLELYTLGAGNYTERDIKEAARCFTGWGVYYSGLGDERPFEAIQQEAARQKRSIFAFCEIPTRHDPGMKTLLGETAAFTPEQALDRLAAHPATARHLARKLWEWFAYEDPEPAVVEAIATAWVQSEGKVKPVLRAIAARPEFWSERCVRSKPKSPLESVITLFRQMDLMPFLRLVAGDAEAHFTPVRPEVRGISAGASFLMSQQGLLLMYPPSVAGWNWNRGWISSNNTMARINLADTVFRGDDPNRPLAVALAERIKREDNPTDARAIAKAVNEIFDAGLPPETLDKLAQVVDDHGGVAALDDREAASKLFVQLGRTLFAIPEFQMY